MRRFQLEVWQIAEDCRSMLTELCGESSQVAVQPPVLRARRRVPEPSEGDSHVDRMHYRLLKQATRLVSARRQQCFATGAHLDELIQGLGTGGSMMHIREMPTQYVPLQGSMSCRTSTWRRGRAAPFPLAP